MAMMKEIHSAVPQQAGSLDIDSAPGVNWAAGRISFLDGLKATGIVMVVAVHALSRVAVDAQSYDVMMFLTGTVAVPLFFMADGFLFAHKWTGQSRIDYPAYLRKNALRLLLPWAAFTVLYALIRIGLEFKSLTRDTILLGNDLPGIVKVLYLSGLSHHMYFLLSLFVVRIGMIGFSRMLQKSRWIWLAVCLAYIGFYVGEDVKRWFFAGADPLLLACWGLQFFLLGVVLQKWHNTVKPRALWVAAICLSITAGLWGNAPRSLFFLIQLSYLVGSYAMVLAVAEQTKWVFSMGNDTLGIYLLHAPYIIWAVTALLAELRLTDQVGTVLLVVTLTVLLSRLLTKLMGMTVIGRLMLGQDTVQLKRAASA